MTEDGTEQFMSDADDVDLTPLEPDSDYDGAWKDLLKTNLNDFVRDYFPAVHERVNWDIEPEWLDKEITQVLPQPGLRSRFVDLLANVRLVDGAEQWILLHVEVQTSFEAEFPFRLACYNAGLLSAFRRRVVTLVILADLRESWLPDEDAFDFAGFSARLRFPVCKLIRRLETDWLDGTSLPIQLARAQIESLRTARDPERRLESKWKLVRSLYELGYDAEQLRAIFRAIDRMMRLRSDLEELLDLRLTQFEEEKQMPYVSSLERLWEARGEARGISKSAVKVLSRQCGTLPDDLQERIRKLPVAALEELIDRSVEFGSIEAVETWIAQRESASL